MQQGPTDPLWWQRGVIYQVYPRSFKDTNGDGIGDLRGVTEKLDYLSGTLGIDAVWLSPFYPSPMADFGYDIADYLGVDPMFGTVSDFQELLREAHSRDLKLIIDLVPNHSSDQHPWFLESRSSRTNPRRDWYVWRDAKRDGSPPNNWLSIFGGSAWTFDSTTGQYYLHSFLEQQPDLNWRNAEVQAAMFDMIRTWLDRGVDGFRIDVAHMILKDPLFRDNPPNPASRRDFHKSLGPYDQQLHIHDKGHEDVHEVFRDLRRLLNEYSVDQPRVSIGEIHEFDWTRWASYHGRDLDELHMPFNFGLLQASFTAAAIRETVEAIEAAIPPGAWPNYVLGNHDESRVATRAGIQCAPLAMMLLLTLRGTPTVYYGDELGMEDVPIPPEREQDPFGKNVPGLGLGRDPERTPMQWDASPNAGFSSPDVEPWLPVAPDFGERNVETELQKSDSMLSLTRRLLHLRGSHEALHSGSYQSMSANPEDCLLYLREHGDERVLVALNFSNAEQTVELPAPAQILLSTHLDREGPVETTITLRPHEGCILTGT